jgi:hypothetical protein
MRAIAVFQFEEQISSLRSCTDDSPGCQARRRPPRLFVVIAKVPPLEMRIDEMRVGGHAVTRSRFRRSGANRTYIHHSLSYSFRLGYSRSLRRPLIRTLQLTSRDCYIISDDPTFIVSKFLMRFGFRGRQSPGPQRISYSLDQSSFYRTDHRYLASRITFGRIPRLRLPEPN